MTRVNVCANHYQCIWPSSQHPVSETESGIATAQLQPYPRRTRPAPSLSSLGHALPLFEKSNVLVMYVTNLSSYLVLCIA
jgi:hypothetical protein